MKYDETVSVGDPPLDGSHQLPLKPGTPKVIAAITLLLFGGCATELGRRGSCPDACPGSCETNCIPQTVGQSPSQVTLADWQRCVQPLPNDAVPAPPGTYVNAWQEAQTAGAMQHEWVITRNLWYSGGDQLSPGGKQQLTQIARAMQETRNWVVIENQPVLPKRGETYQETQRQIDQLQQRRRLLVVDGLAREGVPDADQWVIFADDRNVGVRGIEAPQIFNRQFQSVGGRNGGQRRRGGNGGGLGGGGGIGGGGFGGGGFNNGGFGGGGIF